MIRLGVALAVASGCGDSATPPVVATPVNPPQATRPGPVASTPAPATGGVTGTNTRGEATPTPSALDPGVAPGVGPSSPALDASVVPPGAIAGVPQRAAILDALRLVNAQFVAKWPDPSVNIVTDRSRPSNIWTRAVYYEGLMALYGVEPDAQRQQSYYDYAVAWGESPTHPWQVGGNVRSSNADNHACGQTYLDLFAIDPQPVRIAQLEQSIRNLADAGNRRAWWWIDALQMAMPVFTRLGVLRNDPTYFEAMWSMYSYSRDEEGGGLFNPAKGLWWRDADYTPGDTYLLADNRDIYWSRGNGWVLAALARVLEDLPADEPHRAAYEADFRALAAGVLPLQRADGFWNTSLTNPTHCANIGEPGEDGPETSGTALFAYGFAWGIRHGLLDAAAYTPAMLAAWNGMMTQAVQADGFLGWVQPTGAAPCSGPEPLGPTVVPNFEDYGVGCFLLAGSEVMRLAE